MSKSTLNSFHPYPTSSPKITKQIKQLGLEYGCNNIRITTPPIKRAELLFKRWLDTNNEGEMQYMRRHGLKRADVTKIFPQTISIITVSQNYLSQNIDKAFSELNNPSHPYISLYARNRDYHKLMRKNLTKFSKAIELLLDSTIKSRTFVDSAPLLEKPLAEKSGIGWMGKHTNIINKDLGSFFFLGEIATTINLSSDEQVKNNCGSCRKCIDICPTKAITAPYQLNAKKCISYLTIEYDGIISDKLKQQIGNRIYGCDDCQLICPWNKYAVKTENTDFHIRKELDSKSLLDLFNWSEDEFLKNTEGSPIRRIGYNKWQRNLAIAIGNLLITEHNKISEIKPLIFALNNNKNKHPAVIDAVQWAIYSTP